MYVLVSAKIQRYFGCECTLPQQPLLNRLYNCDAVAPGRSLRHQHDAGTRPPVVWRVHFAFQTDRVQWSGDRKTPDKRRFGPNAATRSFFDAKFSLSESECVCEIIDTVQPASLLVQYRVYERRVSYVHNARVRLHRPWSLDPRHLLKWTRSSEIPPRKRRRCQLAQLPPPPLLFLAIHVDKDDIREGY